MLDFSARWGEGGGRDMGNIDGILTLGNIIGDGDEVCAATTDLSASFAFETTGDVIKSIADSSPETAKVLFVVSNYVFG